MQKILRKISLESRSNFYGQPSLSNIKENDQRNYWFNTKSFGMLKDNKESQEEASSSSSIRLFQNSFLHPQLYIGNYDNAKEHFNDIALEFFKKNQMPDKEKAQDSENPLQTSITTFPEEIKATQKIFSLIKSYIKKGKTTDIDQIVNLLKQYKLYDEAYFQLILEVQNNQDGTQIKAWEILLVLTSIFPSTKESEPIIKSFFLENEKAEDDETSNLAQICYIRFSVRCHFGTNVMKPESAIIIIYKYRNNICDFYSTAYEHLWFQRETFPDLNIPIVVKDMTQKILFKVFIRQQADVLGVLDENDVFVEDYPIDFIKSYENGEANFRSISIKQLCYIFTKWMKKQIPIIPNELIPKVIDESSPEEYLIILKKELDPVNLNLLGHLAEFFKKLDNFKIITEVFLHEFMWMILPDAMNYYPSNCVEDEDRLKFKENRNKMIFLLRDMIRLWDTSQYWRVYQNSDSE